MLKLKFEKRRLFSSTFWLINDQVDIGRFDFDSARPAATATYGKDVWRFEWKGDIGRVSNIFRNGTLIGIWGVGNFLYYRGSHHRINLTNGRSLIYRDNFWITHATLSEQNEVIAEMDIRNSLVTVPNRSAPDQESVFCAFVLLYSRLDNQMNIGPIGKLRLSFLRGIDS